MMNGKRINECRHSALSSWSKDEYYECADRRYSYFVLFVLFVIRLLYFF